MDAPEAAEPEEETLENYRAEMREVLGVKVRLRPSLEEGSPCQIRS